MKNKTGYLAMCLMSALLLGCAKPSGEHPAQGEIRFRAVSSQVPDTKTAYSGVVTGSKERIDWITGDYIRIYSNKAYCVMDPTQRWADYRIATPDAGTGVNAYKSIGEIVPISISGVPYKGGLQWADDSEHHFLGIYPSPKSADAAERTENLSATPPTVTISGMSQPEIQQVESRPVTDLYGGGSATVYYPDMKKAYMVAYDDELTSSAHLHEDLEFHPAYTAFHIGITAGSAMTVKYVELVSTTSSLTGNYQVLCTGRDEGTSTPYSLAYSRTGDTDPSSDENKIRTQDLNIGLAKDETLELELFALPLEITNLTLNVCISDSGGDIVRSLELKAAHDNVSFGGNTYNTDDWLVFAPCSKVVLRGSTVPGKPWSITASTDISVSSTTLASWGEEEEIITYGSGPVVNASGLDEVNTTTHEYSFSIYSPENKTWKVTVLDSDGNVANDVTVTRLNNNATTPGPSNGLGSLTGTIGKGPADAPALVRFKLSRSGSGGGSYTLSFSVIIDGYEYSIDSEVVRGDGSGNGYANGDYTPITF